MNRRSRSYRGVAGALLALALIFAQGLQAAAIRACPHHSAAGHVEAVAGAMSSDEEMSTGSEHPDDHVPCGCLGPCGAAAAVALPADGAVSALAPVEVAARYDRQAVEATLPTLRTTPHALPYPNAPPASLS